MTMVADQQREREGWSSHRGFILATIGAAVGLGNIWRFSYVAGENGGGVFLLIYVIFVIAIGLPLVIAEMAIGRRHPGDPVSAFEAPDIKGAWRKAGWPAVVSALLITSYYSVVSGWALRYFAGAVTGELESAAATGYSTYFDTFIAADLAPLLWQAAMLAASAAVVAKGIRGGIERINLVLMPLLMAIVAGLAIHALTLPGSGKGVAFLLSPDWHAFGRPQVYLNALGQAFFSLGIGVAVFVTYGSYFSREMRIPASAAAVALGDTLFAIVAGLAVFGTVFALGEDPAAGPKLAFITFPEMLLGLPGGRWVGVLFFFLLSAAALTSLVALIEVPVAVLCNRGGLSRTTAAMAVAGAGFVLGLPSALSYGMLSGTLPFGMAILDSIDHTVSNFFLPVAGLLVALLTGWRLARSSALAAADLSGLAGTLWIWSLRIVAPAVIAVILLRSLQVV